MQKYENIITYVKNSQPTVQMPRFIYIKKDLRTYGK